MTASAEQEVNVPWSAAARPTRAGRRSTGDPTRVLITDGEQRAALALVRSLGAAGYRPIVCSRSGRSLAGASRFVTEDVAVPDPLTDTEGFIAAVRAVAVRRRVRVIVPVAEPALLAVLSAREDFEDVTIPFPTLDDFRRVCDKQEVLRVANELGIAVPSQTSVACSEAISTLDLDGFDYPVVLKPSRSVAEGDDARRIKLGVTYAGTPDDLLRQLEAMPAAAYPVLLQKRIVGPGVGIFLLVWDGEVRATFAHRRIREKPPAGGVSVYRESVPADPELVRLSGALLDRLDWQGVAMIEYKVDEESGTPYLMEINGRFWGSLQLAIDAGVDFPAILVGAALGRRDPSTLLYRTGIRSRWWWGDVDQLLSRLRRSAAELSLPEDAPSRIRSLLDFMILWRPGDRNEIFRWSDPIPFFRESLDWFARR